MLTHVLYWILSAVGTALSYLLPSEPISYIWVLPVFLGFLFTLHFLTVLSIPIISIFLPMKETVERPSMFLHAYIRFMMRWLMPLCNVKVMLEGAEGLPKEPIVLVSNHRSMFDPMVILQAFRDRNIALISKVENFKIPIARRFFANAGYLPIDRKNAMRAMRTIKRGCEMMKSSGVDIGIYPEGTRSKTGELLEFKPGAFLLAKKADAPVVVLTTSGTEKIPRRAPFRRTTVRLSVVEIIDRETVKEMSLDDLCAHVRSSIDAGLARVEHKE